MQPANRPLLPCIAIAALSFVLLCFAHDARAQRIANSKALATTPASIIDIDGNGIVDAEHDGLLMLRYMSGVRGAGLIAGALGPGATRFDAGAIEDYLAALIGAAPSDCRITAQPASSDVAPLAAGTPVQLTASCLGGFKPLAYDWGLAGTGVSISVSPAQTTTYSATPSNGAGTSSAISATVYVITN